MKNKIAAFLLSSFFTVPLFAQVSSTPTAMSRINTGISGIADEHAVGSFTYNRLTQNQLLAVTGKPTGNNQFFTKDWTGGSIVTVRNETFSSGLLFLFDKVNNVLYFKINDTSEVILTVNSRSINSFTINSDKPHTFKPGVFFSSELENKFVEILTASDSGYVLLKVINSAMPGEQISGVVAATVEEYIEKYKDEVSYYIYHNGIIYPVELKKKTLMKNMQSDKKFIEMLNRQESDKITESSLTLLINKLNLYQ